ncbi:hypothetical protein BKA65DRAFT_556391 [Rhexocercosporidium sp. MPI-PUGE-AT-0058]|nr:hypothetical protein BKA65DRAFT_556391 [Rhexocercosporidium sp. MPI-PUGE-AT-0058]
MEFGNTLSQRICNVSQAATEFCKNINDATEKSPKAIQDALWSSWREFSRVVAVTKPEDQERLVQFLLGLRKGGEKEKKLPIEGEENTLKNLPLFGPEMRYVWNETPDEESSPELAQAWVNRNAFPARITAVSKPNDCMDYSLYCVWSIRNDLEDIFPEEKTMPPILKAAAMWMIYAAREIYQRAVDEQTYDGKLAIGGRAVDGKGWKGHSKKRWELWAERFEKQREAADDEETRRVVGEALKKMEELDD